MPRMHGGVIVTDEQYAEWFPSKPVVPAEDPDTAEEQDTAAKHPRRSRKAAEAAIANATGTQVDINNEVEEPA